MDTSELLTRKLAGNTKLLLGPAPERLDFPYPFSQSGLARKWDREFVSASRTTILAYVFDRNQPPHEHKVYGP